MRMNPPVRLSAEDQSEADELLKTLTHRVREVDALSRYLTNFHRDGNIDVLRCFDKLLTVVSPKLFITIDMCQCVVVEYTDYQAADFLTTEMLRVYERVHAAFTVHPKTFDHRIVDEFCAYTFLRMSRAEDILFLLEQRGITDTEQITIQGEDLNIGLYTESLRDGVL